MGIKSLQNLLFIPIFTYKLMKKCPAKHDFLMNLGIDFLGKGFFIPTVARISFKMV